MFLKSYSEHFPHTPVMIQEYHYPHGEVGKDLMEMMKIVEDFPLLNGVSFFEFHKRPGDHSPSENQLSLTSLRSISALPPAPLVQEVTTLRDLGEHEPEYDYIVSMFQNSMVEHRKSWKSAEWCEKPKVEVTSIESVVNPVNQPLYVFAREEVKRGNPGGCEPVPGISAAKCQALTGSDLNEYFLFHGSCYQQVGEILREGLDPQRGGESAGSMFGKGTYFAENASKADMYTTCDLCTGTPRECRHPTGQRCMMLAQVLRKRDGLRHVRVRGLFGE
eukprot:symbB.v1.2.006830.t1/scaffold379.1/size332124/12